MSRTPPRVSGRLQLALHGRRDEAEVGFFHHRQAGTRLMRDRQQIDPVELQQFADP